MEFWKLGNKILVQDTGFFAVCERTFMIQIIRRIYWKTSIYRNETNRITYVDVCGFDKQRKIIASVCVAALPIGKAGVLEGRNATTYHLNNSYRQKELAEFGVNVMNEPIVVDKNIITSYSPQTANDVAFIMLERLLEKRKLIGLEKGVSGWN